MRNSLNYRPPDIARIRERLAGFSDETNPFQCDRDRASVAMALAGPGDDLSICLIRRVERVGDPWSGHMALPGGRASEGDCSAQAVAEREAREEVGLDLTGSERIAALPELPVRLGGLPTSMILAPFVYYAGPDHPRLVANSREVAEIYWVPLAHLWDPRNGVLHLVNRNGQSLVFPAIRYQDRPIWGLTLRVLTLFSDLTGAPLP
jgi:8-oxo-dGTP pyrophosphatase MutT (NUDIX family)